MFFSLWNFKDWFDREGIELSYMINSTTAEITSLTSSAEDASVSGTAGILSGEELTDCSGFHSVLAYKSDRILFPAASPAEVWNHCSAMMEHYTDWETDLLNSIHKTHTLSSVFLEAGTEFPFPMAFILKNGTIHHKTDDFALKLTDQSVLELVSYVLTGSEKEPVCRSFRFNPLQTFLASPVYFGTSPAAILVAYEKDRRFQPGYFPVFQAITSAVQTYYQFYSEMPQATHLLSGWFFQMLNPNGRPVPGLDSRLQECGWSGSDYYQIACIDTKPGCPPSVLQDAAMQLSDPSYCCVAVNNELAVLRNLGADYPKQIPSFCNSIRMPDGCRMGISLPFHTLEALSAYYEQARWALHRTDLVHSDSVDIISHLSEYILDVCKTLPDGQALIHPDILQLAESDAASQDELLKTLYTYYICGHSISHASENLFIHRNTMRQRLNKIQSVLSADLEDPDAATQYLLSIMLFRA